MKTNYTLKHLDDQFMHLNFMDEGEFNRWQWYPINYYEIGPRVDLTQLDDMATKYRGKGGSVLRFLSRNFN